jgi:hypothetical protein
MGIPDRDDGSIERADLDGGNRWIIIPQGVTQTPKQMIRLSITKDRVAEVAK